MNFSERSYVIHVSLLFRQLRSESPNGEGEATQEIMQIAQCSDRRIRDWSHKYNQQGLGGLRSNWQGENALKLSRKQRGELKHWLHEYRPDEVIASTMRVSQGQFWTVSDLQIVIKSRYDVSYKAIGSYRTILHDCGFSYQRTELVYRSRSNEQTVADFEADLEKK